MYRNYLKLIIWYTQKIINKYINTHCSDIHGRRIILISGIVGTMCAMTFFGFSSSFEWAIIARCLTGFFNGNLGVVKVKYTQNNFVYTYYHIIKHNQTSYNLLLIIRHI